MFWKSDLTLPRLPKCPLDSITLFLQVVFLAGYRRGEPQSGRRVNHAERCQWQPERPDHNDRRKSGGHDSGPGAPVHARHPRLSAFPTRHPAIGKWCFLFSYFPKVNVNRAQTKIHRTFSNLMYTARRVYLTTFPQIANFFVNVWEPTYCRGPHKWSSTKSIPNFILWWKIQPITHVFFTWIRKCNKI